MNNQFVFKSNIVVGLKADAWISHKKSYLHSVARAAQPDQKGLQVMQCFDQNKSGETFNSYMARSTNIINSTSFSTNLHLLLQ